jgi:hypothetical protein
VTAEARDGTVRVAAGSRHEKKKKTCQRRALKCTKLNAATGRVAVGVRYGALAHRRVWPRGGRGCGCVGSTVGGRRRRRRQEWYYSP